MKTFSHYLLLAVLLIATSTTATAKTGTMERFGAKMKYTFSGGIVTDKKSATISGVLRDDMTVPVKCEIEPGETITLATERVEGPNRRKTVCVEYFIQTTDGKKLPVNKKEAEGVARAEFKVPTNAKKIYAFMTYDAIRTKFKAEIEWTVIHKSPYSNKSYSGSFSDDDVKVAYTITGAELKRDGDRTQFHTYMWSQPGVTLNLSTKTVSGASGKLKIQCWAEDAQGNVFHREELKNKTSASMSYTIPKNATKVNFQIEHDSFPYCWIQIWMNQDANSNDYTATTKKEKTYLWLDRSHEDEKCYLCKQKASPLYFEKIVGNGVVVGCTKLPTKTFKKATTNRPIYIGDGIVTDENSYAVIRWGVDGKTAIIKPNSKVFLEGMVDGKARWRINYGKIE